MNDLEYMAAALEEARAAAACEEVPVGAVVVREQSIIARGRNRRESLQDPTAHAEILALKEASSRSGSWRLHECALYVTLEPCIMCVGAIIQARVGKLVFGCLDPKAGAVESLYRLCEDRRLNHQPEVRGGILGDECARILKDFFGGLRTKDPAVRKKEIPESG
ncbi:MAG: tRNA adenosine(34) deaminase TadA [Candidatus Binatia bacterium]